MVDRKRIDPSGLAPLIIHHPRSHKPSAIIRILQEKIFAGRANDLGIVVGMFGIIRQFAVHQAGNRITPFATATPIIFEDRMYPLGQ